MMDVVSKEFNTNTSSVQLCASPKTENVNMMTKIKNVGGNTFVQSNSEKNFFFLTTTQQILVRYTKYLWLGWVELGLD